MEIWKDIVGFEDYYEVSNMGNIRRKRSKRLRKIDYATIYPTVLLSVCGIHKTYRVHRIVANAFLPKIEGKNHVNHKNGNKRDNRVRAEANKTFSDMLKRDLERRNGSMGFRQWIYCHKGYEIDGAVVNKGEMHRNESTRPVMNTENWRPATVEEIKEYYKKYLL